MALSAPLGPLANALLGLALLVIGWSPLLDGPGPGALWSVAGWWAPRATVDWYPLAPWAGFAFLGLAAGLTLYADGRRRFSLRDRSAPTAPLRFLGRHALPIYLVHQLLLLPARLAAGATAALSAAAAAAPSCRAVCRPGTAGLAAPPHGNYPGTCTRGRQGCHEPCWPEEARMEDKPQFRVDYEATTAEVGIVILEGEIDIYSAPEFKEVLVNGIEGGAKRVIVDLSAVTFIDSTALGVLVSGAKRVRPRNGNLDIVCTDENIIRIFEITGLDRIFGIFPSRGEALKAASA